MPQAVNSHCRTLVTPTFGLLFCLALLFVSDLAFAQTPRPKLVTIGTPQAVRVSGQLRLRPQLAVADRLVVQFSSTPSPAGVVSVQGRVSGRVGRGLGHGMYLLELPAGTDIVAASRDLRGRPGVLLAEPDIMTYPAIVPNDPQYSSQFHLPQIKAPAGWDVTTGSADVVIAIIDSGLYLAHPDVAGKIWTNPGEIPGNRRDDDNNGFIDDVHGWDFYDNNNDPNPSPNGKDDDGNGEPDDQVNHGTLVAGTAAAIGNDGYGCAGVCWGGKIMPLQVFPDDGSTAVSNVISAINYAVANGADVINLSIGGSYTPLFTAPIAAAYNAGVVVVTAGGNEGSALNDSPTSWQSPVCNDGPNVGTDNHAIGVGAVDRFDRLASFSNFDTSTTKHFIDIVAPGEAIYGIAAYFPSIPGFNSYYQSNSGTSFSAPIISGLVGLLIGRYPTATPAEIIDMVRNAGDNIDSLNPGYVGKMGGGRINCGRALGVDMPPAAAQDLAAADTAGDDGGSITITWRKSPDDGSGSGKVTGYMLFRRETASSTFSRLATLPKGTETYVDAGAVDGADYYYKLRTTDGTLTSDTGIVGPVNSRNDAPPAQVAGLVAYDRPNDEGGAIVLGWNAYTAPADFAHYSIYRSSADFASTGHLTPVATVTNPSVVSYVDTSVSDGVDYFYVVGVRDTAGNEVRNLRAIGPVQSFSNDAITFAAGLHFLGPATVSTDGDPATLFGLAPGSFSYARWSPSTAGYVLDTGQRPLPNALKMDLGRGAWVKFNTAVTVHPTGRSAPAGDFSVDLSPGWHQLANPFFGPMSFRDATVTYQGATMDLSSAESSGIMGAFAWVYDSAAATYMLAYPRLGNTPSLIPAWRGFWVLCTKACTLTMSRPISGSAVRAAGVAPRVKISSQLPAEVAWTLPLRVSSVAGVDANSAVGVASRALAIPKPPAAGEAPVLTIGAANASEVAFNAVSLAQASASDVIWKMQVSNLRAGQTVRLSAPDLSPLPREAVPLLEDLATGQLVYLRTSADYVFTPRAGESQRQFRLTVGSRSAAPLQVQGLTTQAVRAGGARIAFTLSAPAACTVSVMNMAGREVRLLEEGKLRPAGNSTIVWDGRGQLGTKAPAGLYLLQVMARTPTGQSVRVVSPLKL